MRSTWLAGAVACVFVFGGCDQAREYLAGNAASPPTAEDVEPYYAQHGEVLGIEISGNVVELKVRQPYDQIRRGGSLWARVGPYVYLLTPATQEVFHAFPGVAAVRVVTYLPDGEEVARAMLRRDTMGEVRWRRTRNLLGYALRDGQESPRRLEQLVEWGEDHTEYRYNPRYVN